MIEQTFERQAEVWLETGPTELPANAIDLLIAAIADVPQERPPIRLFRRSISRFHLRLAAAAVVLVVAASGAIWLRPSVPDVAHPRTADDLLFEFPSATTFLERSGKPAAKAATVDLGGLPAGGAFVIAGSCTGGDGMLAQVFYPGAVQAVPTDGGAIPSRTTMATLTITCDGLVHHLNVSTDQMPAHEPSDVALTVPAGTTWRIAIGEYREFATTPEFPPVTPANGWYVVIDAPPDLVTSSSGIGIQVPDGASKIAAVIQCSGDPVSLTANPGGQTTDVSCDDPATVARVEYPAIGPSMDVTATTQGVAWVHLSAEANGRMTSVWPTSPPLPDNLAAVGFAETDGQYLAFGSIGSNVQTSVNLPGSLVGIAGGTHVGVAVPDDGGGTRLELWSIGGETPVRTIARVSGTDSLYRSWVDATHEQVYYGIFRTNFSAEWRRVAFDGTGDRLVADVPTGWVLADADLAIDDSAFVVDWCPAAGTCKRVIDDAATGTTRDVRLDGDRTCELIGVVAGRVVARSAPTCGEPEPGQLTVQDLDGGPRRVLVDRRGSGVIVRSTAGDRLFYLVSDDVRTSLFVVGLDGGAPKSLGVFDHTGGDHTGGPELALASVGMPAGNWVLLGGPFADTPSNRSIGRPTPRLLNVITGDQIELVNLPHSAP